MKQLQQNFIGEKYFKSRVNVAIRREYNFEHLPELILNLPITKKFVCNILPLAACSIKTDILYVKEEVLT